LELIIILSLTVILMSKPSFPQKAFKLLIRVEEKHFWFCGRNKTIASAVERFIKNRNISFLELGCGTGFVLSYLEKMGFKTTGLDIYPEALKYARKRTKSRLISADILKDQLSERFDAAGLFDVLEHIEDQAIFLKKTRKLLKKKGMLFITVPADQRLWSDSDELSGHKRRYNLSELKEVLENAGFEIKQLRYFGFFLYLPLLLTRRYDAKKQLSFQERFSKAYKIPSPPLNYFLNLTFSIENILSKIFTFPLGSSIIAVAQKL